MKPFRGVFSARPLGDEPNGDQNLRLADPPPEIAPGLVPPRPGPKHLLWEVLVELGFVDERRVLEAEAVARASRQDLGAVLLERGLVSRGQLARAVAQREGVLFADLAVFDVDERAAALITPAVAERYGAIPIGFGPGGEVLLALSNPRERHAINDISMMVEPSITRVVATQDSIDELIRRRKELTYEGEPGGELEEAQIETELGETPLVGAEEVPDLPMLEESVAPELGPELEPHSAHGSVAWFEADAPVAPPAQDTEGDPRPAEDEVTPEAPAEEPTSDDGSVAPGVSDPGLGSGDSYEASVEAEPAPSEDESGDGAAAQAIREPGADRELLESLSRSVGEVERLVRDGARAHDAELEATSSESERRLSGLRAELERERSEHAETERGLREQLETERTTRDESERKLREDSEVERVAREQSDRGLREELESERAARAESERGLREELEAERATREALATEIAAVRTARDDLARRVASARDLLETGARPFVPLNGRER